MTRPLSPYQWEILAQIGQFPVRQFQNFTSAGTLSALQRRGLIRYRYAGSRAYDATITTQGRDLLATRPQEDPS